MTKGGTGPRVRIYVHALLEVGAYPRPCFARARVVVPVCVAKVDGFHGAAPVVSVVDLGVA